MWSANSLIRDVNPGRRVYFQRRTPFHNKHLPKESVVLPYQSQTLYVCNNTGGLKYTGDSVVQIRTFINLTSEFGSSTRGARDTILNHSILTKLERPAHLIVFKTSVGRDLQNSIVRLQLLNTMVLTQLQLSTWPKSTPNRIGPSRVPNSTRLQSCTQLTCLSKYPNSHPMASRHDVIHAPVSFPIWGLLWKLWLSYPLRASVNCAQWLCTWTKSRIVQSPTKLNDKI